MSVIQVKSFNATTVEPLEYQKVWKIKLFLLPNSYPLID